MDLVRHIVNNNNGAAPPHFVAGVATMAQAAVVAHVSTPRASLPTVDVPAWSLPSFLKRHMGECFLEHTAAWVRQTWRDLDRGGRRLVQVFAGTRLCNERCVNMRQAKPAGRC